jgi:tetratricopeptide (TPR) repeat protein
MLTDAHQREALERQLAEAETPDDRAVAFLKLGWLGECRKDWEDAVLQYGLALEQGAESPGAAYYGNNNRAYSLIQLGRFDEAEPHCLAAIEIIPKRHNAHKNLGLVRQGQGRWAEAAHSFVKAAALCPADGRARHLLNALLAAHPDILRTDPTLDYHLVALAVAEVDVGGVVFRLQGVQARRAPGGGLAVVEPHCRGPYGGWYPGVLLPEEVHRALAELVRAEV